TRGPVSNSVSHPLLTAPVGRSLWRLAAPTTAVMIIQTFVAIAETYFFGRLGTDALAGFALVFPFMMLMQMMAAGGMGGGGAAAAPGRYMLISSLLQIPLSGVLALGIADWDGLGMAGPAASSIITMSFAALLQARALWRGKMGFKPSLVGIPLRARLFWEILKVGLIASFSALTANLTAML